MHSTRCTQDLTEVVSMWLCKYLQARSGFRIGEHPILRLSSLMSYITGYNGKDDPPSSTLGFCQIGHHPVWGTKGEG